MKSRETIEELTTAKQDNFKLNFSKTIEAIVKLSMGEAFHEERFEKCGQCGVPH